MFVKSGIGDLIALSSVTGKRPLPHVAIVAHFWSFLAVGFIIVGLMTASVVGFLGAFVLGFVEFVLLAFAPASLPEPELVEADLVLQVENVLAWGLAYMAGFIAYRILMGTERKLNRGAYREFYVRPSDFSYGLVVDPSFNIMLNRRPAAQRLILEALADADVIHADRVIAKGASTVTELLESYRLKLRLIERFQVVFAEAGMSDVTGARLDEIRVKVLEDLRALEREAQNIAREAFNLQFA